jgi:fatty acid desaturase
MAKETKDSQKTIRKRAKKEEFLPLEKVNYIILLAGMAIIALGYIALSSGAWDGPMALTVAPILLVAGYCAIIPFGILYRPKKTPAVAEQSEVPTQH